MKFPQKDAKIEVLEMQLEAAKQQRDERVVQSLLEAYTEQQKMNREHIGKMQEEQQTFCKTQIEQLQQDQQRYMLKCESKQEAVQEAATRSRGRGQQSGHRLLAPMMDGDNRPCSWQALPQYEPNGCQIQPANRYHENQNNPIQMHSNVTHAGHNDSNASHMVDPARASLNHSNGILPPPTSVGWPAQPGIQYRDPYLQSSTMCNPGYIFNNQSTLTPQTRPAIPNLQTGISFGKDGRPSAVIFQQRNEILPHLSPPTVSSNTSGRWNTNKLRPSPVAAIAPQVKPQKAVHPTQGHQTIQENREVKRHDIPRAVTKRKKTRKQYQVAIKTKRQSARVKAKQTSSSCERKEQTNNQENQPRRGRQPSQKAPKVNSKQPVQTKNTHHWPKS